MEKSAAERLLGIECESKIPEVTGVPVIVVRLDIVGIEPAERIRLIQSLPGAAERCRLFQGSVVSALK